MPYGPFQGWTKLNTGSTGPVTAPAGFLNKYIVPRRPTTWVLRERPTTT